MQPVALGGAASVRRRERFCLKLADTRGRQHRGDYLSLFVAIPLEKSSTPMGYPQARYRAWMRGLRLARSSRGIAPAGTENAPAGHKAKMLAKGKPARGRAWFNASPLIPFQRTPSASFLVITAHPPDAPLWRGSRAADGLHRATWSRRLCLPSSPIIRRSVIIGGRKRS